MRSSKPIPGARQTLAHLQRHNIPFILLTNGGGVHESDRATDLSQKLGVPLHESILIQSHTPFAAMAEEKELKTSPILVVGGAGDNCRRVAEQYGFAKVVTPGDIVHAHPSIWPFSDVFASYYQEFARPLPRPIDSLRPSESLKIEAVFVFNDPRDWALDAHVILDLLMSSRGVIGTLSHKNNDPRLPNRGFQQDSQPPLYFSNPDLWWAAEFHIPRLGQGGFREALEGIWAAVTGGKAAGVELLKTVIGKPHQETFEFAEARLRTHRTRLAGDAPVAPLKDVYFIGDNPESDIRGANGYRSSWDSKWHSILVDTGVYSGRQQDHTPSHHAADVRDAIQWALKRSGGPPIG